MTSCNIFRFENFVFPISEGLCHKQTQNSSFFTTEKQSLPSLLTFQSQSQSQFSKPLPPALHTPFVDLSNSQRTIPSNHQYSMPITQNPKTKIKKTLNIIPKTKTSHPPNQQYNYVYYIPSCVSFHQHITSPRPLFLYISKEQLPQDPFCFLANQIE